MVFVARMKVLFCMSETASDVVLAWTPIWWWYSR